MIFKTIRWFLLLLLAVIGIFWVGEVLASEDLATSTVGSLGYSVEVRSTVTSTPSAFCLAVFYSDWSVCQDSKQSRAVVDRFPKDCILSKAVATVISQNCTSTKSVLRQEVLGVKVYNIPENVLVRGSNKKIYSFKDDKMTYVSNLSELKKYAGQKIFNIGDDVIASYMPSRQKAVAGIKEYADGSLIRGSDMRVYQLVKCKKKHILNLEELRKYHFGKTIFNVSDETVAKYEKM
jgi:hypothetical protein